MRFPAVILFLLPFLLLSFNTADAQHKKPVIVGQKDLSAAQGTSITIRLTDLIVEERNDEEEDDKDDEEDDRDDDNDHDDNDNDRDDDDEDRGDDDDEDREDDDDEDRDDDDDEDRDNDDDDDGKNRDEDDDDDDNDRNKDDKKKNKGKNKGGNGRQTYPDGYVLEIFNGKNYSFSGTTVTPHPDFYGPLTVVVRVRNAAHTSPNYDLKISVKKTPPAENKPPVITGHSPLSTPMNTPLTIKLSDLAVSDPDNAYPQGFSLTLMQGDHYIVDQTTVNPKEGFTGNLKVPAVVNDGKSSSAVFNLKVTVTALPAANTPPQITGQLPLNISVNQSVNIVLALLIVNDPDNDFPEDFSLEVFPGENYTRNGNTVKPVEDFVGDIFVPVSVHDGKNASAPFDLKITVNGGVNHKPVITGQGGLKIPEGESLNIEFHHLIVQDNDNEYPKGFTLTLGPGSNYLVSGHKITPAAGFIGMLKIPVVVNDGKTASDPFRLRVEVVRKDRLEIVGQHLLEILEDSSLAINHEHLIVNDPSKGYPKGIDLFVLSGEDYDVTDNVVKPREDFYGNLSVAVTVSDGSTVSAPFFLLVVVTPVNDPPELMNVPTNSIAVTGPGPWPLFQATNVVDRDDAHVLFAEVRFDAASYRRGLDKLQYEWSDSLHVVFDEATGTLFMVGRASLERYTAAIRSISYTYTNQSDSIPDGHAKNIYLKLSDGKDTSPDYERTLMFETDLPLEIPTAFTPNNDNANDTWKITSLKNVEQVHTFIRVYDKRGNMVFESSRLENEWDGHFNGSPLPADVYFYTIEMDLSSRRVNYKGIVAILR